MHTGVLWCLSMWDVKKKRKKKRIMLLCYEVDKWRYATAVFILWLFQSFILFLFLFYSCYSIWCFYSIYWNPRIKLSNFEIILAKFSTIKLFILVLNNPFFSIVRLLFNVLYSLWNKYDLEASSWFSEFAIYTWFITYT